MRAEGEPLDTRGMTPDQWYKCLALEIHTFLSLRLGDVMDEHTGEDMMDGELFTTRMNDVISEIRYIVNG